MAKNTNCSNVEELIKKAQQQNNVEAFIGPKADKEKGIEGQQNSTKPNKITIAGKPPKPKRDRQLNVQIDAEHLEKIKKYAKSKGLSVAELLEQLIDML